jgi:ribosomal protein S18 acetylase RimI-like enzyme
MHALMDVARNIGYQELWVYTGSSDDAAVCFYKSLGFKVLGSARLGPWPNDGRFGHRAEANALARYAKRNGNFVLVRFRQL